MRTEETRERRSARLALWAVLVLGVALVVAPFAMGMPAKASSGADMMDDFRPLMDEQNVDTTAAYYNDVFVPLRAVVPVVSEDNTTKFEGYLEGMKGMGADAQKLIPDLAQLMGGSEAQVQEFFAASYPSMSAMLQGLPTMTNDFAGLLGVMRENVDIFEQVPAGLDHYQPLVTTMQANVDTYADADSMPSFDLLTWFFVVPGALLVLASLFGLYGARLSARRLRHPAPHPTA